MRTESADPFGDELRELEAKAVADEPAPEPRSRAADRPRPTSTERSATGKLDKEELRRAVKGADAAEDEATTTGAAPPTS